MPGNRNHFDLKKSGQTFPRLTAQVAPFFLTTDGSTAGGSLCAERDSAGESIFHRLPDIGKFSFDRWKGDYALLYRSSLTRSRLENADTDQYRAMFGSPRTFSPDGVVDASNASIASFIIKRSANQ